MREIVSASRSSDVVLSTRTFRACRGHDEARPLPSKARRSLFLRIVQPRQVSSRVGSIGAPGIGYVAS